TVSIDAELVRPGLWLDDARPAHAGHAARRCKPGHDFGFEPANRVGAFGYGIGKGPGAAAWIPLTAGGALGRIAGPHGKAGVVPARPVEADLSPGSCPGHGERDQQAKPQLKPIPPHARLSLARPPPQPPPHATPASCPPLARAARPCDPC